MDPLTLSILAGGYLGGKVLESYGSRRAADKQLEAAKQAEGLLREQYGRARGYQQPYLDAGQTGLGQLMSGNYETAIPQYQPGEIPGPYTPEKFNFEADPGYAFRQQEGTRALQAQTAGSGTGLSGATLKALQKYGQGLASQEYGNAFNRYMSGRQQGLGEYQTNLSRAQEQNRTGWEAARDIYGMGSEQANRRYGRAFDLTGMGERAAGRMGDLAVGMGGDLAGIYGQRGNVMAQREMGGYIPSAGRGMQDLGSLYMMTQTGGKKS